TYLYTLFIHARATCTSPKLVVTYTTTQDTWYKNREKLKRNPVRLPERPKLQPIIDGFRITTNTAQDTWYKIREKMNMTQYDLPNSPNCSL
ncbi:hypothetical protein KSS87_016294, partial [Heliosperma pusillum]